MQALHHYALRGEFLPFDAANASFYFYSIHLKSGSSSSDEDLRALEAQIIRDDGDALGDGVNIIYGGDFNWNSSDERDSRGASAWDVLTSSGDGEGFDAFDVTNVSGAGNWRGNLDFLALHSQDPGGSMDDRFDVQFVSNELFNGTVLELVQGSYRVFSNSGTHDLNGLITTGTGASPDVLMALVDFSDHLPVLADFKFTPLASIAGNEVIVTSLASAASNEAFVVAAGGRHSEILLQSSATAVLGKPPVLTPSTGETTRFPREQQDVRVLQQSDARNAASSSLDTPLLESLDQAFSGWGEELLAVEQL